MPILFALVFSSCSHPEPANTTTPAKKTLIPKSQNGTINLSFNVSNRQDARSNNSTNVTMQQTAKQPVTSDESPLFTKVSELWQENIKIQKQLQEKSAAFISSNKWYVLSAGLVCTYGLLAYFMVSGNSYLGDSALWSSWRQELPLDQLLAIPQQKFAQELIREIQRRYTDASSLTDIAKPLGIFMNKIDQEEEQIKWYQSVYSWLSYGRLPKLVPVTQQRFSKIPERLQRIAYYKNVFKSWAADYQLQQAERMWYRCPEKEYPGIPEMSQLLQVEMKLKVLDHWLKQLKNRVPCFQ